MKIEKNKIKKTTVTVKLNFTLAAWQQKKHTKKITDEYFYMKKNLFFFFILRAMVSIIYIFFEGTFF